MTMDITNPTPTPDASLDTSVLSGASDPSQTPPASISGGIVNSAQPAADTVAPPQAPQPGTPQAPDNPRPWKGVLTAALAVLSGAAPGFGQKTFAAGVGAGARSVQEQQQLKLENAQKSKQMAMEEQRSMDEHQTAQANLATAHLTQQTLAAQYDTMPKTTQDIIDRQSMAAGETAKEQPGAKVVGTFGTYMEAQANQSA